MTFQAFPLAPVPNYYSDCLHLQRNGIFYEGEHVCFSVRNYGADTCTIRDYHGNIVSVTTLPTVPKGTWGGLTQNVRLNRAGGGFNRYELFVSPNPPVGGWDPGWYRAYLTGPNSDQNFGNSYGVTNFCVIRTDANFPRLPASQSGFYGGYVPAGDGDTNQQAETGTGNAFGDPPEVITGAGTGIGIPRFSIFDTDDPDQPGAFDNLTGYQAVMNNVVNPYWLQGNVDPVRTRYAWLALPNANVDRMNILCEPPLDWAGWLYCFVKTTAVDGATTFVKCEAGSVSGFKITIRSPDANTIVETYDNLATSPDAATAINASSNYVKAFADFIEQDPFVPQGPTAIGTAFRDGMIEIVSTLYPLGITHYEGPFNEPAFGQGLTGYGATAVHQMMIFQDSVHAGNANAKAIGPCTVNIHRSELEPMFNAGMGNYCDEISVHDYNSIVNGDINLGRNQLEDFFDLLQEQGQSGKPVWQTEATHVQNQALFAVYHPRKTHAVMAAILLWEQYGVPYERNVWWYTWSHGFWSYSAWLYMGFSGDKSCNPPVVTINVLAQETFGKAFHHRIDFGSVQANSIFLGNVYGDSQAGSVAAVMAGSYIPGAQVTFTVTGSAGPLTVVDGLGNESSVALSSGRITVDVEDIPTYVQLPAGANVSVYSVNDWGPTPNPSISTAKRSAAIGGVNSPLIADGQFFSLYTGESIQGIAISDAALPDTAEVLFYDPVTVDRVIVWTGPAWQLLSTLLDYDIQTFDGAIWTTRATVTKTPDSFQHGANSTNSGSERETYWDEQWIEDVEINPPVSCTGVRVYARQTSYGGEPDPLMVNDGTFDLSINGTLDPHLVIQEIGVISGTAFAAPTAYETEVLADSPIGYWRLGESSGTTAASEVNSPTLDGTYFGGFELGAPGLITSSNTALNVENASAGVTVIDDPILDVGDVFTLECWFKPTYVTGPIPAAMIKRAIDVGFGVTTGGFLSFGREAVPVTVATSSVALTGNEPAHCVVTKNGATTKIYLNGEDVTVPGTDFTFGNYSSNLTIGGDNWFVIDEVAYYGTALSAARVLAHYRAGTAPNIPTSSSVPVLEYLDPVSGTQLACTTGRWNGTPTVYTYQWQTSPNNIAWGDIGGETKSTYVIQIGDVGDYLRCGVTASNPGGSSSITYSGSVQVT